ncbi:MAG: LamG domain-containing protein [Candidatus Aureabacteria bacterium]|nr:LamG domain-containing protein [Candidatus Auribacterota bacterium]
MKKILLFLLINIFLISSAFATDWTSDANCQAAWLMEVDEDPLTDSSGNGLTAAHVGSPTHLTASPPDTYSTGYYDMNGSSDAFSVANAGALRFDTNTGDPDFSIIWWMAPDVINDYKHIFDFTDGTNDGWRILIWNNGVLYVSLDEVDTLSAGSVFSVGVWVHCAGTYDRDGNITIYINGVSSGTPQSISGNGMNITTTTLDFGYTGVSQFFNGDFDEVAMFDKLVNSTEVNDIIDNGLAGAAAGWTHDWNGISGVDINGVPNANMAKVNGI